MTTLKHWHLNALEIAKMTKLEIGSFRLCGGGSYTNRFSHFHHMKFAAFYVRWQSHGI